MKSEKCIDSLGRVYETRYINFGHPVGCVYPSKIEFQYSMEGFKAMTSEHFPGMKEEIANREKFEDVFNILSKL